MRFRRGMPIFSSSAFSKAATSRLAEAGWVWNSRSISAEETKLHGGKALVELSRGEEALEQVVGQRFPVW